MMSPISATIISMLAILALCQAQAIPANICTGHAHMAVVRNTQHCGSFYQCLNGRPFLNQCVNGENFNPITRRCELASLVDCFACPADELFIDLPVVNECQQFVRCFNNQSQQLTCADGLMFDREVQQCNLRQNVTCPWEIICPPRNDELVFIRDRTNCARFYLCVDGKPLDRLCPRTLVFNTQTNQCDLPENVECESTDDYLNENPVVETFRCPDEGGPLFPHNTNCRKFHTCSSNGLALTHTCPNDSYFDYLHMFCGNRDVVTCKADVQDVEPFLRRRW